MQRSAHSNGWSAEAPADLREYCAYTAGYARKHRDLIAMFGRFPHRNTVLDVKALLMSRRGSRRHPNYFG